MSPRFFPSLPAIALSALALVLCAAPQHLQAQAAVSVTAPLNGDRIVPGTPFVISASALGDGTNTGPVTGVEFFVVPNRGATNPVNLPGTNTSSADFSLADSINYIQVTSAGSGFLTPPPVIITGGGGSNAAAFAVLSNNQVASINVFNGGSGYTNQPTVQIGYAFTNAEATPQVGGGGVTNLVISNAGSGYDPASPPSVTIELPPAGTQAEARATVSNGVVTNVTLFGGGGAGYFSVPDVTFADPPDGVRATALAQVDTNGVITNVVGTTRGSGYYSTNTNNLFVTFSNTVFGSGSGALYLAQVDQALGQITNYVLIFGGTNYTAANTVVQPPNPPEKVLADGRAQINTNTGVVTNILITEPGFGYSTAPLVTISDPPAGVRARFTAQVGTNSQITNFTRIEAGSGYATNVIHNVTIAPPTGGSGATAVAGFGLNTNSISNSSFQSGYPSVPPVTIRPPDLPGGTLAQGEALVDGSGTVTNVRITVQGSGYTSGPVEVTMPSPRAQASVGSDALYPFLTTATLPGNDRYTLYAIASYLNGTNATNTNRPVVIGEQGTAPTVVLVTPQSATATAVITNGTVTNVSLVNKGTNYTTSPSVFLVGGGGTNASASASINTNTGQVTNITTNSVGGGYTSAPSVLISPPSLIPTRVREQISINAATGFIGLPQQGDSVAQVDYYVNGILSNTVTAAPYLFNYTPQTAGYADIFARATTSRGITADSGIVTYNVTEGTPPTVSITTPSDGLVVPQTPLTVSWNASDADGSVTGVQLLVNGAAFGAPSTSGSGAAVYTPSSAGSYVFVARATDNLGNVTDSTPVTVTIDNTVANPLPLVNLLPQTISDANYVVGSQLYFNATAVARTNTTLLTTNPVSFSVISAAGLGSVNAVNSRIKDGANDVYSASYEFTPVNIASSTLFGVARATNNTNATITNVGTSAASVLGSALPVQALPSVEVLALPPSALTNPVAGGMVQLRAKAAFPGTNVANNRVEFYAGGAFIGIATNNTNAATLSQFTHVFNWTTPTNTNNFQVTARAVGVNFTNATTSFFGSSLSANSTSVNLSSNTPPTVSITTPASNNAVVGVGISNAITATATAAGSASIREVQFYLDGIYQASVTNFPYTFNFAPASAGLYNFAAVAIDSFGLQNSSAVRTISATTGAAPTVTLTSPAALTNNVNVGQNVTLEATAGDTDGSVAQVEFVVNGLVVNADTAAPYRFIFPVANTGRYEVLARATDNLGNVTDSPAIVLSGVDGTPPTASFTINSSGIGQQMPVDNPELSVRADGSNLVFSFMRISGATYTVQERENLLTGVWTPKTGVVITRTTPQPTGVPEGYEMAEFSVPISGDSRFYRLRYDATVTDPNKANLNETLDIVATASAASGSVSLAQLLVNGQVVDQLTAGPYNFTRQMTNTGRQEFVIRVTDNLGNVTDTAPQTVIVSAGAPPRSFLTTSSSARASAVTNSSGGVASFTNLVGGSGYSTNTNQAPLVRMIGGTTNTAASATAQIGVSGSLTNVLVTAPGSGYTNVPTVVIDPPPTRINETVILQATATDDQEVRSVGFLINGLIAATVTNAPYTNAFIPSNPGFYQLVARATDNLGNVTDSPALTLRVEAPTNSLTVVIDTPTNNTRFVPGTALTTSASVTSAANYPVASVTYYLNGLPVTSTNGAGTVVGPQITSAPYSQQITLANVGDYTLSALAFDTFGNSAMKDVKISSVAPTNGLAPGITVVHPVPAGGLDTANDFSAPSQLYLNAIVTGDTGTNPPVFFANGVQVTSAVTSLSNSTGLTYGVRWFPSANGTYSISAQITGTNSNALTAVSAPLTFLIGDVSRPLPTISLLGLGQTNVRLGSTVTLQAEVGTDLTPIDRVDFYANQVLIGSTVPPVITNGKTTVAFNWQPPSTNDYAISARAQQVLLGSLFDNSVISTGSTTNTNDFILKVQPNESNTPAPVVVLAQQPIADGNYVDGSSLFFNVAVTPDGTNTVSTNTNAVSFYFDGVRITGIYTGLAQNETRTYAVQQNILPGSANRSLYATAIDSQNLVGGSATANLRVAAPRAPLPAVEMLPLLPGTPLDAGGNVTLRARAIFPEAASGESRLEFYANNVLIGVGTADELDPTSYSYSWRTPATGAAYVVKARAVALNFGNAIEGDYFGSVISDNATDLNLIPGAAPNVNITAPLNGATVSVNQPLTVRAHATVAAATLVTAPSDANGKKVADPGGINVTVGQGVAKDAILIITDTGFIRAPAAGIVRQIYVREGDTLGTGQNLVLLEATSTLVTAPSDANGKKVADPGGINVIAGQSVAKDAILIITDTGVVRAPVAGVVAEIYVAPGQTLTTGENLVRINSNAGAGGTIGRLEFYANGVLIGTDSTAPYEATFTPESTGLYRLAALAYSQAGLVGTSDTVTVSSLLGTPPTVTLAAPAKGVIGQTARLVANPSVSGSGRRIDQVEFLVNNLVVETLTVANEGSSYVFNYPVTAPGNYLLQARAKDNVGNVGLSNVLEMPTRTAPSVVLTAPTTGAIGQTITMTAEVTNPDANGNPIPITNVQFFVNGNLIETDPTSPYSANYNILAAGDYQLQAVAIDDEGVTGSSNIVNLNVPAPPPPDPSAPSVSIVVPTTGSTALIGTAVDVLAAASPGQGAEFSSRALTLVAPDGTTSVLPVTITVSGFSSTFTPLVEGPYVVTARVLNSLNKEATATATVIAQTTPPFEPGSNEAFIIDMYQKILGREPTASEIYAGLDELADPDFSRADFVYAMVTGQEYGNVQNRVADFFFTLGAAPTRTNFAANVATVRGNTNLMTGFDNYGNSTLWASPSPFGATLGQVASAQSVVNASSFTSLNATNGALVTWMWDRLGGATASWPEVTSRLGGYASSQQQGAVVSFLTANYANLSPFGSVAALASAQQAYQYQLRATAVRFLLGGPWQATGSPGTVQSSLTRLAQLEISTPLGLLSFIERLLADTAVVLVAPGASASATASATLGGSVTNVLVTTNGTNYSTAPSVIFEAPRFTTALATPNLGTNGSVTNVTLSNNTNGFYTNAPAVTLGINGSGALATAVAELGSGATAGQVTNIRVTAPGSGFSAGLAWVMVASPAPWQATSGSVGLSNGRITNITVAEAGTGYRTTNPAVLVGAPQALPATNNTTVSFSARRFTNAPLVNVSSFQLLVNGKPVATNNDTVAPAFTLTPTNGVTNSITNRISVRAMNGSFTVGESAWTDVIVAPSP